MQTSSEQITVYISEKIQHIFSLVTSSHLAQVELTVAGLVVMFSFIVYIVTKVINNVDTNEYIEFEHEEEYED